MNDDDDDGDDSNNKISHNEQRYQKQNAKKVFFSKLLWVKTHDKQICRTVEHSTFCYALVVCANGSGERETEIERVEAEWEEWQRQIFIS